MPYIQAGSPQKKTNNPGIVDVYHSGNVYINNVPVALWVAPGSSAAFAGVDVSIAIEIPEASQIEADAKTADYLANPDKYYNADAAEAGVKPNFAGTPNDATTATSLISDTSTASDIVPFLTRTLEEASRKLWRETGQNGAPSNPNITGIWKNLGYPSTGAWNSDQTAWCMGFVNFALKSSGYRYVQTAWAYDIRDKTSKWNATKVPNDQAQPGDIALWSFGHVNFVYQKKANGYSFVGGNQSPKDAGNNPNNGDVTISWPNGCPPGTPTWAGTFRPSRT